ncbi:hypothetical protein KBT16_12640 [Nostoc sp. CCCryo 231-06]|nr:hypothetical protein [Nostoc sp. CCCryo 231-06]
MQNNQRFGSDLPSDWKSQLHETLPTRMRRAERLAEQLRALGIKPDWEHLTFVKSLIKPHPNPLLSKEREQESPYKTSPQPSP